MLLLLVVPLRHVSRNVVWRRRDHALASDRAITLGNRYLVIDGLLLRHEWMLLYGLLYRLLDRLRARLLDGTLDGTLCWHGHVPLMRHLLRHRAGGLAQRDRASGWAVRRRMKLRRPRLELIRLRLNDWLPLGAWLSSGLGLS